MLRGGNVHYEMAERTQAVGCGGMGVTHTLVQRLGLVKDIDEHLELLRAHLPYHESDHVLNIAYNFRVGGPRRLASVISSNVPNRSADSLSGERGSGVA